MLKLLRLNQMFEGFNSDLWLGVWVWVPLQNSNSRHQMIWVDEVELRVFRVNTK